MGNLRYVDVIEAAYRGEASDQVWLRGVLGAVEPLLDQGHGVGALRYRFKAGGALELLDQVSTGRMQGIEADSRQYFESASNELVERMFRRTDAMFLRKDVA